VLAEVRDLARRHGAAAIGALAEIALNPKAPPAARVAAAEALLDRGYGRPVQAVQAEVVTATVDVEQLRERLAARLAGLVTGQVVEAAALPAAPGSGVRVVQKSEEVGLARRDDKTSA
jgi:hypothetical protein